MKIENFFRKPSVRSRIGTQCRCVGATQAPGEVGAAGRREECGRSGADGRGAGEQAVVVGICLGVDGEERVGIPEAVGEMGVVGAGGPEQYMAQVYGRVIERARQIKN